MKITNVSPLGDLDVPLLGPVFKAGTTLDVTEAQASALLGQQDNYEPADDEARVVLGEILAALSTADPAPPADPIAADPAPPEGTVTS